MKKITKVQKIQFELMKLASFNNFDGKDVVSDLIKNRDLWKSCVMDRNDLLKLRDIPDNVWNVDVLYILTEQKNLEALIEISEYWFPNKLNVIEKKEANELLRMGGGTDVILSIWWD